MEYEHAMIWMLRILSIIKTNPIHMMLNDTFGMEIVLRSRLVTVE